MRYFSLPLLPEWLLSVGTTGCKSHRPLDSLNMLSALRWLSYETKKKSSCTELNRMKCTPKENPALLQNEAKLSSRSFHLISMKGYTVYCVSSELCLCWRRSQMQCDVGHGDQTTELVSTSVATRSPHRVSLKMNINCCIFSLQFLPLHHVAVSRVQLFWLSYGDTDWMYWALCYKYIFAQTEKKQHRRKKSKGAAIFFFFYVKIIFSLSVRFLRLNCFLQNAYLHFVDTNLPKQNPMLTNPKAALRIKTNTNL